MLFLSHAGVLAFDCSCGSCLDLMPPLQLGSTLLWKWTRGTWPIVRCQHSFGWRGETIRQVSSVTLFHWDFKAKLPPLNLEKYWKCSAGSEGGKKYLLAHTFTQLLPCNILQVIAYFVCHNVSLNISDECSSGLQTKCTPTLPAGLFVQAACTSDAVRMWRRWRFRCFCIIMMCQLTRCRLTKGPPWLRVRVIHPVRLHLHFPLLSSRSQSGQCLLLCPCGWLCTFRISLNSIFFFFFCIVLM